MIFAHLAAALLMVTIWGAALGAGPVGEYVEIPRPSLTGIARG
jgi:hypothetical protein